MCPGTLALVGAGISAGSSVLGGFAQQSSLNYQAQVARNNAITARQNAAYSASATAASVEQAGLKARAKSANLRAGLAAGNIDVNSGSAGDVQTSERLLGKLDTANVGNRGAQQVYGYETQATSYQAQAGLLSHEAAMAPWEGALKGAGTLLSNPTFDNWVGGGGGGGGGGGQDFAPGATGNPTSLMSGMPSVPEQYQFMQDLY
jgi:hypothetical protein